MMRLAGDQKPEEVWFEPIIVEVPKQEPITPLPQDGAESGTPVQDGGATSPDAGAAEPAPSAGPDDSATKERVETGEHERATQENARLGFKTPGTEAADAVDKQVEDARRGIGLLKGQLEDFVGQGGSPVLAGLGGTALDLADLAMGFTQGLADTARLGQGLSKGTLAGAREDLDRLLNTVPQGRVVKGLSNLSTALQVHEAATTGEGAKDLIAGAALGIAGAAARKAINRGAKSKSQNNKRKKSSRRKEADKIRAKFRRQQARAIRDSIKDNGSHDLWFLLDTRRMPAAQRRKIQRAWREIRKGSAEEGRRLGQEAWREYLKGRRKRVQLRVRRRRTVKNSGKDAGERREARLANRPDIVEAAHRTSGRSGQGHDLVLEEAYENQWQNKILEQNKIGGWSENAPKVVIGGVPVSAVSAAYWESIGLLRTDAFH